jgi:hypothetical protein
MRMSSVYLTEFDLFTSTRFYNWRVTPDSVIMNVEVGETWSWSGIDGSLALFS